MKRTAKSVAKSILANVDLYYSDTITYAEFNATARGLWTYVSLRGEAFRRAVSNIVMPKIGAL